MFIAILGYAFYKKVNMYDNFIDGAKEGFSTILSIMPTLIGLMVAVGMLRASGAIDLFVGFMAPFMKAAGFPKEAVPLSLMRLISSSAATGLLLDIFQTHGPDSFIGRFVSVMMSCTETVFYTMSVYFMSVKITKTRYTLAGALFANVAGILASILITRAVF
jgi:spore maturation protein B